jgi:haloalkane dehalogenase
MVRNLRPLATLAVQGFNLFARGALFMAVHHRLPRRVRTGLIAPYNCWQNRIATLKFVQDIPVHRNDPSYNLVKAVDQNLHKLAPCPMLICWGRHDFVFDTDYLEEWQRRFPEAEVQLFADAGHYVLEDKPAEIVSLVKEFLTRAKHPTREKHANK